MAPILMHNVAPMEAVGTDAQHHQEFLFGEASLRQRALRVLVVGDQQETVNALVRLVCCWGHTARVAYDGHAALRAAAAQHPNVVFLDMNMQYASGCDVASRLRVDFPRAECLIIAFAGSTDDERRQHYREAGIDLLLIKPIDPQVVETLLLLECERTNRSQANNGANVVSIGRSPLVPTNPWFDERVALPAGKRLGFSPYVRIV